MSMMKVTLIQMDIVWGDINANCATASWAIDCQPGSDLYVLPEMFSTGFATQPEGVADASLQSLTWMKMKAAEIHAAVCGSVATQAEDGTYRNRLYFVKPDGETAYYDKHHLFAYGNEHHHYTAGQERVIVEWKGVRFLLQICYDLRFPCFSRNVPTEKSSLGEDLDGLYDCAIYVASWPASRIEPWRALLKARAIENQCYVLGVDRIGSDPVCSYCGGTEGIDSYGRIIAACPDNVACQITMELDMEKLSAFRKKFPVLNDADRG